MVQAVIIDEGVISSEVSGFVEEIAVSGLKE